jgi:hypothetical protein
MSKKIPLVRRCDCVPVLLLGCIIRKTVRTGLANFTLDMPLRQRIAYKTIL